MNEPIHSGYRAIYSFYHGITIKTFGPYNSADEARDAFQRVYGYWPGEVIYEKPYSQDLESGE